jgi:adenylate cyclase
MLTIFLSLLILLISIFIISKLASRIVQPLNKLTKETEHIKNFNLDGNIEISSRIKEIISLSEGLNTMKKGLRSFQKYVPSSLVHQIIRAGADAKVGGSKRKLVILFSDIENFTSITQKQKPAVLMSQLNEYLNILSECIIDKYVGDSIMAFWGAPLKIKEPAKHAANAALKCIHVVSKMHSQWSEQGLPTLFTRIGIHLGDSIVGNVGSSKRMNYTAVGDSINIASRLETVNKFYGTTIIVSEAVYKEIKNSFIFRFIDKAILHGTTETAIIYQLLAKNKTELSFDIDEYNSMYAKAFVAYENSQWDEAIFHFNQCLEIYPEDTVAHIFINRCQTFKSNPPAVWDGIWGFQAK